MLDVAGIGLRIVKGVQCGMENGVEETSAKIGVNGSVTLLIRRTVNAFGKVKY